MDRPRTPLTSDPTGRLRIYETEVPVIVIKTDTGDPSETPNRPIIVINTYDNNVKIWADGAWRSLATW